MITKLMVTTLVAAGLALTTGDALAFGGGSTTSSSAPAKTSSEAVKTAGDEAFAKGRAALDKKDYHLAIFHLEKAVAADPKNADAENLLGFSYRKVKDFDSALTHYQAALRLNPNHKGAHEYLGEAYLETGKPEKAREHLAVLEQLCPGGCEELDELKEKIADYKSGG